MATGQAQLTICANYRQGGILSSTQEARHPLFLAYHPNNSIHGISVLKWPLLRKVLRTWCVRHTKALKLPELRNSTIEIAHFVLAEYRTGRAFMVSCFIGPNRLLRSLRWRNKELQFKLHSLIFLCVLGWVCICGSTYIRGLKMRTQVIYNESV